MNSPDRIGTQFRLICLTIAVMLFAEFQRCHGAGVTLITHGQFGSIDDWVIGMAGSIPTRSDFVGTNVICYEIQILDNGAFYTVTPYKLGGGNPLNEFSDEIVIKLDWSRLAGIISQYDTYTVAQLVVPKLLASNYIPELGGHALAELPLHLIGHSRGGSVVCEMSKLLGMQGVWVDQVTTLDPHPVNNDGNIDLALPFITDAPLRTYENVLFADNYYQDSGGYPHGQFIPSAFNRYLPSLSGGYYNTASLSPAHGNIHLWYHGTTDFSDPAYDGAAFLEGNRRSQWYAIGELNGAKAGFYYSRLGRGDRLSTAQPAGVGTDRPVYGLNQIWNFGAGQSVNRSGLPSNDGSWPNVIKLNLIGTNVITVGESNTVDIYYQWEQPTSSVATISFLLDDDLNPYNGNQKVLRSGTVRGTGAGGVSHFPVSFGTSGTNASPGYHTIYAQITGGGRTRYLYAPEILRVLPAPFLTSFARTSPSAFSFSLNGSVGANYTIQASTNLSGSNWFNLFSLSLTSSPMSLQDNQATNGRRFYRVQKN